MGMPAMINRRKTSRQARPVLVAARAVRRHGQDQREDGELRRLQLQGPDAEPARRPLGAAAHDEDTHEGEDDQPVADRGQRLETPVVEHGHHDHGDEAEDDEEPLLLEEGPGVLTLGQERATGGGVDHHHADGRDHERGQDQDPVERGHVAPGGNVCSGECGHNADSGTEYRP